MNYHNITYPDMNNGDGLRVALWLSGCSHHCYNCQNPQTWDSNSGILFDEAAKEELFRELERDYISGITFTGGDPLFHKNLNDVLRIIITIRKDFPEKTIWLYSGFSWKSIWDNTININVNDEIGGLSLSQECENTLYLNNKNKRRKIISQCDVMVDGRYIDSQRDISLKWRGSKNQQVIDVQKSLRENKIILYCD